MDISDHPWWRAHKVPDSLYKTFGGGDLGISRFRRLLFWCGSGNPRRMRRRSVTVRLGLGHPGPLRLCLAGRGWCAGKRRGRRSLTFICGRGSCVFTNRSYSIPHSHDLYCLRTPTFPTSALAHSVLCFPVPSLDRRGCTVPNHCTCPKISH